jgi:hypothetical protein
VRVDERGAGNCLAHLVVQERQRDPDLYVSINQQKRLLTFRREPESLKEKIILLPKNKGTTCGTRRREDTGWMKKSSGREPTFTRRRSRLYSLWRILGRPTVAFICVGSTSVAPPRGTTG